MFVYVCVYICFMKYLEERRFALCWGKYTGKSGHLVTYVYSETLSYPYLKECNVLLSWDCFANLSVLSVAVSNEWLREAWDPVQCSPRPWRISCFATPSSCKVHWSIYGCYADSVGMAATAYIVFGDAPQTCICLPSVLPRSARGWGVDYKVCYILEMWLEKVFLGWFTEYADFNFWCEFGINRYSL